MGCYQPTMFSRPNFDMALINQDFENLDKENNGNLV